MLNLGMLTWTSDENTDTLEVAGDQSEQTLGLVAEQNDGGVVELSEFVLRGGLYELVLESEGEDVFLLEVGDNHAQRNVVDDLQDGFDCLLFTTTIRAPNAESS